MDQIDARILRELQNNARITVHDLSERVGLSPSPCARRIRLLEKAGVIAGYRTLIDENQAGFPFSVFISVRLVRQGRVASITGQARSTLTRENGQPTDSNLAQPSSVILLRARTPICASVF